MNVYDSSTQSLRARRGSRPSDRVSDVPVICFSHLRWSFVWQRPQHILTRFAHRHPVYVVEEPTFESAAPRLDVSEDQGVTILTPVLSETLEEHPGFNRVTKPLIRELISAYFEMELSSEEVIAWYYTPMAFGTLPATIKPVVTVYDAMDELANFRNAPKELRDQERHLMQAANLVFSGGPSLHESRKYRHPRAFCFPSGVDEAHFRYAKGPVPEDIASLQGPIIGFYGVLDERIDFELIASLADARPDWNIVMIGPVIKIDESELAQRPNIHYLGKRSYDELPRYLARFDTAILPFADNESTQFISPTKTLEYLAGGKPVVSTPIRDVVDLYGDVVEVASTANEFIEAIERQWRETPVEQSFRKHIVTGILADNNWDVIASRMQRIVNDVLMGRPTFAMVLQDALSLSSPRPTSTLPGPIS